MAQAPLPEVGQPVQILPFDQYDQPGVYFLYRDGVVVYVGQSGNMRQRIGQHLAEAVKHFDAVSCLPCRMNHCLQRERYFITKLMPLYNRCKVKEAAKPLAKLGWDRQWNHHTEDGVQADTAAAMLGVSVETLRSWGHDGPKAITKRIPRTNIKRKLYLTADLREFAETNPHLLSQAA